MLSHLTFISTKKFKPTHILLHCQHLDINNSKQTRKQTILMRYIHKRNPCDNLRLNFLIFESERFLTASVSFIPANTQKPKGLGLTIYAQTHAKLEVKHFKPCLNFYTSACPPYHVHLVHLYRFQKRYWSRLRQHFRSKQATSPF